MQIDTEKLTFLTIRGTAQLGILPEHALRAMHKAGQLPGLTIPSTKRFMVNVGKLIEQLSET